LNVKKSGARIEKKKKRDANLWIGEGKRYSLVLRWEENSESGALHLVSRSLKGTPAKARPSPRRFLSERGTGGARSGSVDEKRIMPASLMKWAVALKTLLLLSAERDASMNLYAALFLDRSTSTIAEGERTAKGEKKVDLAGAVGEGLVQH